MNKRATNKTNKYYLKGLLVGQALLASTLAEAAVSSAEQTPIAKATESGDGAIALSYKKGELVSFVFPDNKPGNGAAAQEYGKRAFPIAGKLGLSNDLTFNIEKIVGDFDPDAMVLYSWPSAEAETQFNNHPDWAQIKATRPDIWEELRVYTAVLPEDLSLIFKPQKVYTIAIAWTSEEKPNDYHRYFSIIDDEVKNQGGRFMYKMFDPNYEAHVKTGKGPGQITLVEWDQKDGFQQFVRSKTYQEKASNYFRSGVDYVEFFYITPR